MERSFPLLTSPIRRTYDLEDDFFILGNLWRGMWNQRVLLDNPERYDEEREREGDGRER